MAGSFLHLLKDMRERGVRRLGVLAMGRDDTTSEPNLSLLRQAASAEGVAVSPELMCRVRVTGLDLNAQWILVRNLLGILQPGDGLYAVAPDSLELVQTIAQE
jgi:hypothetical protein